MTNVYIVGAGIHPFGRHESSGLDQGVFAVRQALKDVGLDWKDTGRMRPGAQMQCSRALG